MTPEIEFENERLGMEIRGEFDEERRIADWKCAFSIVPICGQLRNTETKSKAMALSYREPEKSRKCWYDKSGVDK